MDNIFSATMTDDMMEMKRVISELNNFLKSHYLEERLQYRINLAIEEPLVNIITYGSKADKPLMIQVELELHAEEVSILLTDNGNWFNPLSIPRLDIRKAAIDRPTGGLGMHLVRHIMQAMWYERRNEQNIFKIHIAR